MPSWLEKKKLRGVLVFGSFLLISLFLFSAIIHETQGSITPIKITNNETPDENPQIYDGMITWQSGGRIGESEIFLYDGSSVKQINR
jgi:hypothetical protein